MAGVDVGSGDGGGRRNGNFEINMIPMIDLLMVTISFLLITAEWMHMSRIEANAIVPGPAQPCDDNGCCDGKCPKEKKLHVSTTDGHKFVLTWKEGATVVSTTEIESDGVLSKADKNVHYPDLAATIVKEWKTGGAHHARDDASFDQAVIHASNEIPYSELVGVMDAVSAPRRPAGKNLSASAFNVSFAVD